MKLPRIGFLLSGALALLALLTLPSALTVADAPAQIATRTGSPVARYLMDVWADGSVWLSTLTPTATSTPSPTVTPSPTTTPTATNTPAPIVREARGYMTSPAELRMIASREARIVDQVLSYANRSWDYTIDATARCPGSDYPTWLDNDRGGVRLYAKAVAYHLTGDQRYAEETRAILNRIVNEVQAIGSEQQCRLNFAWGIPEVVAAADLIEGHWTPAEKRALQDWLTMPYTTISFSAEESQSNWGAAATNALAYIADYLHDRPDIVLNHRLSDGSVITLSPAQAYERANLTALNRMNGYRIEYGSSSSCDTLSGPQQSRDYPPVKSQITERGIIPEDARRDQYCNVPAYNGAYQNYPQIHLGSLVQQSELQRRRGDTTLYDNVALDTIEWHFFGPDNELHHTTLYAGRGSIRRAIDAVIVDSKTTWRHDAALELAYKYYRVGAWRDHLSDTIQCAQDVCFGKLAIFGAPVEAQPLAERTVVYEPPPTFTPSVFVTPTADANPTPTADAAILPTLAATAIPKPTVTPTPALEVCYGVVEPIEGLNARAQPSFTGAIRGAFVYQERIPLYRIAVNGWFETSYYGAIAWVYPAHVGFEHSAACEALPSD